MGVQCTPNKKSGGALAPLAPTPLRVAYYFAFVDHTLYRLQTRFPPELEGALLATFLLLGNTSNLSNETIADIKREFADHLPYPSSSEGEVATWKVYVAKTNDKLKGTDLSSTCNFRDENKVYYPNIHATLFLSVLARANDPSVC